MANIYLSAGARAFAEAEAEAEADEYAREQHKTFVTLLTYC